MSPTPRLLAIFLALTASSSLALLWKLHQAQQRIASLQASQHDTAAAPSMAGAVREPPSAGTTSAGLVLEEPLRQQLRERKVRDSR